MKLSKGQISVLRHCAQNEAVVIWATTNPKYFSFWDSLPGASPSTFHSLVRRGLLRVENSHFHYITESGRVAIGQIEPVQLTPGAELAEMNEMDAKHPGWDQ